jgi:hypothetical protein
MAEELPLMGASTPTAKPSDSTLRFEDKSNIILLNLDKNAKLMLRN